MKQLKSINENKQWCNIFCIYEIEIWENIKNDIKLSIFLNWAIFPPATWLFAAASYFRSLGYTQNRFLSDSLAGITPFHTLEFHYPSNNNCRLAISSEILLSQCLKSLHRISHASYGCILWSHQKSPSDHSSFWRYRILTWDSPFRFRRLEYTSIFAQWTTLTFLFIWDLFLQNYSFPAYSQTLLSFKPIARNTDSTSFFQYLRL
jgi:hypothetical protein